MTTVLSPAQTADRVGLTLDTLRYYEREGLIGPVQRSASGHRVYTDDDVFWIGLVSCLRAAGLGIADLRDFTSLLRVDGADSDRVAFLRRHRAELEDRAKKISAAITVLDEKIDYYRSLDWTRPVIRLRATRSFTHQISNRLLLGRGE